MAMAALRVLVVLGVLALLAVWAVVAAGDLIRARHDLLAGRTSADAARGQTSAADLEAAVPVPALHAAAAQFHKARSILDSPVLFLGRFVPVAGRQLQSARALALAGATAADVTAQALTDVHASLATHPQGGPARLAQLQHILAVATTADRRLRALDYGPRIGLAGPLADGRNRLTNEVGKTLVSLERGLGSGRAAIDLLQGDHRVLILATNNSEMQAGSGMPLELGVLHTNNGSLHLDTVAPDAAFKVPPGVVPTPPDLQARWGWLHPSDNWESVLSSPRFDMTAPVAAQMFAATGQAPVDAVMALDPVLLADIVGVTGPVTADGLTLAGGQLETQLLHDQYNQASVTVRQDQLGDLARATFARFDAGGWSLTQMGQALAADGRGRHVILWSRSPTDEAGWDVGGVAGALGPHSLMVNVLNRGRNKLDYFLTSASTLSTSVAGGETKVTVTVHLADTTPPGQTGEVLGRGSGAAVDLRPGQQLSEGDYLGIVSLSAPGAATGLSIDGVAAPSINGRDGPTQVVADQFIVRRGGTLDVTFHFTVPGTAGSVVIEPSARAPGMTWTYGAKSWSDTAPRTVAW